MTSFEDALRTVLAHASPLSVRERPLAELPGCCLAQDVCTPFELPRFDNSAVDGFAVRMSDVERASPGEPVRLPLLGVVRAGDRPPDELPPGAALKVMTGAPLSGGVEAVVMREFTEERDGEVIIRHHVKPLENIRQAGEEFRTGQRVLARGTRVTPPVLGLLAALGFATAPVFDKPRVAIVVTGDELVPAGRPLQGGQIYDSNTPALLAACRAFGLESVFGIHTQDTLETLLRELERALPAADVVMTVGGASAGDYDYVLDALNQLGARVHHTRVAMKPGKPNLFATLHDSQDPTRTKLIFGLPGNPVSALLSFHLFVRPTLLCMMGASDPTPLRIEAVLGGSLTKKAGRLEFVRARLVREDNQLMAYPTTGQDSHMLGGLAPATGLIHFPEAEERLARGQRVTVELLSWC